MTEPNLATWLLEGGLSRIAENLARVMQLALGPEGVRAAGEDDDCQACVDIAVFSDTRVAHTCGKLEADTSSDTPCGCDESVRLRAEVEELSGKLFALQKHHNEWFDRIVNGKGDPEKEAAVETIRVCMEELAARLDESRAEVEKLKAVADAARVYRKLLGSTDGMWIHEEHRALAVAVDAFEKTL